MMRTRHCPQRGHALTQRMLVFARTQALTFTSVDLGDPVRAMADLLQLSLGPTVWIDTRFPLDLPAVRADGSQLELALLNLSMNARDAMDAAPSSSRPARKTWRRASSTP